MSENRPGIWQVRTLFFALILSCPATYSALLSPADRNEAEQQQQELLRQNQLQREALEHSQTLNNILSPAAEVVTPGLCFTLHTITLDGAEHLSSYQQRQLTTDFIGQCLNLSQINQMVKNVSNAYIQQGYITSRAFLTGQDLSLGRLNIRVLEGKLETITLEGQSSPSLTMAFSDLKGKILNLRDIEQGMEQINRVRKTPVKIEILPGKQVGYSTVNLTATPESSLFRRY